MGGGGVEGGGVWQILPKSRHFLDQGERQGEVCVLSPWNKVPRRGAKSYDSENSLPSIDRSIFSGPDILTCEYTGNSPPLETEL